MIREAFWMARYYRAAFAQARAVVPRRREEWKRFWASYRAYASLPAPASEISLNTLLPALGDDGPTTPIEPIYFYQDCWAFERIVQTAPASHVDVGSQHKFVALLSKVMPVTMVDIRPLSLPLNTLEFREGSILALPFADGSVGSLSSMCVIEHIGLGRYGDPLDGFGTEKSAAELKRVLAPGGDLYISVPLDDRNTTYFNAHRAFTEEYITELFSPFEVVDRKYIYGDVYGDVKGRGFGTGCFHFRAPR